MKRPTRTPSPEALALAGCVAADIVDLNRTPNVAPWATHGTISAAHAESCDALAEALALVGRFGEGDRATVALAADALARFDTLATDMPLLTNVARTATFNAIASESTYRLISARRGRAVKSLAEHGTPDDSVGFGMLADDLVRQTSVAFNKAHVSYLDARQTRRNMLLAAESLALALAAIDAADDLTRTVIGPNAIDWARSLLRAAYVSSVNARYFIGRDDESREYHADVTALAGPDRTARPRRD